MDLSRLSQQDQVQLLELMQELQIASTLDTSMNMTETCFRDCVNDFTSTTMTGGEEKCVSKCAQKFLNFSNRMMLRFAEENNKMQQKLSGQQ